MKRQQQPSKLSCGQTCVAMILGVPVAEIIKELSDERATTADELLRVLRPRHWYARSTAGSRALVRGAPTVASGVALCRVKWGIDPKDKRAHWVLWTGAKFLDPLSTTPIFMTAEGGRVLSHIALEYVP